MYTDLQIDHYQPFSNNYRCPYHKAGLSKLDGTQSQ